MHVRYLYNCFIATLVLCHLEGIFVIQYCAECNMLSLLFKTLKHLWLKKNVVQNCLLFKPKFCLKPTLIQKLLLFKTNFYSNATFIQNQLLFKSYFYSKKIIVQNQQLFKPVMSISFGVRCIKLLEGGRVH